MSELRERPGRPGWPGWGGIAALVLLSAGCDGSTSEPAVLEPPSTAPATEQAPVKASTPAPEQPVAPAEPPAPSPPVGGPSCDQRELVSKPGAEPRRVCIDYSDHKGAIDPRCFEGIELSEGACASDGVIAACTLEATGVTMRYYEGASADQAGRDCDTIGGVFELR